MFDFSFFKQEISVNRLKDIAIIMAAIAIIFYLTILPNYSDTADFFIVISFCINAFLWTFLILSEILKRAYSLNMIHYFFCLFFFFFAALVQYLSGSFSWVGKHDESVILFANAILTLWTFFYCFGVNCAKKNYASIRKNYQVNDWNGYKHVLRIMTFLSILITLYRISFVGINNLFSLGSASKYSLSDNGTFNILVVKMMVFILYYSVAFSFFYLKNTSSIKYLIINSLCLLISFFPTAVARNNAAGVYLGLLLLFFSGLKKNRFFFIIYLISFLVIFPFLNSFRLVAFSEVNIGETLMFAIKNISRGWLACDYDAYSMLCVSIEYVTANGLSMGYQLLGVMFFFIPRSIWITKPGGTGEMIGDYFGWPFINVSEPLPAEAYVNFGVIGIMTFAFFVGYFFTKIDNAYWNSMSKSIEKIRKIDALYCFMIGFSLFLFRGALLSAFAYLTASFATWFIFTRNK